MDLINNFDDFEDFFNKYKEKHEFPNKIKIKNEKIIIKFYNDDTKKYIPIIDITDVKPQMSNTKPYYIYTYCFSSSDISNNIDSRFSYYNQLKKHHELKNDYNNIILDLFTAYFEYVTSKLNEMRLLIRHNGWDKRKYLFVNNYKNYQFIKSSYKSNFDHAIITLYPFLENHPDLLTIFSYGILSVSNFFWGSYENSLEIWGKYCENDYETDNTYELTAIPFAICIYGTLPSRSAISKKDIADTFLNYISKTTSTSKLGLPHFSINYLDSHIEDLWLLGDVPIIMYPSGNTKSLSSSNTKISKIEMMQLNGYFKGFPVYISETAIHRDRVMNIHYNAISNNTFDSIKPDIHTIISEYLSFLQNNPYERYSEFHNITLEQIPNKILSIWDNANYNQYLRAFSASLCIAFSRFIYYLQLEHPKSFKTIYSLENSLQEYLKSISVDSEYQHLEQKHKEHYSIKALFSNIIRQIIIDNPSSIIQHSNEYYILYDQFVKTANNYFSANSIYDYTPKSLLAKCRDNNPPLIITGSARANGKNRELFLMRKFNKPGVYEKVIVIPSNIYEHIKPT